MCKLLHISNRMIAFIRRWRNRFLCWRTLHFQQIALRGFNLVIPVYNEQTNCISSIVRVGGCERVHEGLAVLWEVMEKSGTTCQQGLHPKRMEFPAAPLWELIYNTAYAQTKLASEPRGNIWSQLLIKHCVIPLESVIASVNMFSPRLVYAYNGPRISVFVSQSSVAEDVWRYTIYKCIWCHSGRWTFSCGERVSTTFRHSVSSCKAVCLFVGVMYALFNNTQVFQMCSG